MKRIILNLAVGVLFVTLALETNAQIEGFGDLEDPSTTTSINVNGDAGISVNRIPKVISNSGSLITVDESNLYDVSDNIGIGISSPVRKLHLHAARATSNFVHITDSNTGTGLYDGLDVGIGGSATAVIWNRENTALRFGTNNKEYFRIENTGKVGIGTVNPVGQLEINCGSITNQNGVVIRGDMQSTNDHQLVLMGTNGQSWEPTSLGFGSDNKGWIGVTPMTGDGSNRMEFWVKEGATTHMPMVIWDGNVGVGLSTTAPVGKLHIANTEGGNESLIHFSTNASGHGANDGVDFGIHGPSAIIKAKQGIVFQPDGTEPYAIIANNQFIIEGAITAVDGISTTGVVSAAELLLTDGPDLKTANGILTINGSVGIGTQNNYGYKLAVNGNVICTELKIETYDSWSDYVFEEDYDLRSLEEVESYIKANKHLPNVPSAQEVQENGYTVNEMNATLLEKIEELTLYVIEQNKKIEELQKENKEQQTNNVKLSRKMDVLQKQLTEITTSK